MVVFSYSNKKPHCISRALLERSTVFSLKFRHPVSRKIGHLVSIRIGISKMAKGDEYLDYDPDGTIERMARKGSRSISFQRKCKMNAEHTGKRMLNAR